MMLKQINKKNIKNEHDKIMYKIYLIFFTNKNLISINFYEQFIFIFIIFKLNIL